MPRVPRLQENRIQEAGYSNARFNAPATEENFGGGRALAQQSEAIGGLGDAATRVAVAAKRQADEVFTADVTAKLADWETQRMYDPEKGALSKRGQDALAEPDAVKKDFESFTQSLMEGATSDSRRAIVAKLKQSRGVDIERSLNRHVGQEIEQIDLQSTAAALNGETQAAISNYTDPERITAADLRIQETLMGRARRTGEPAEVTATKVAEARSKMFSGVIARYISNGDDRGAQQFFQQHRESLTGTARAEIEDDIRKGMLLGESQRTADKIFKDAPNMTSAMAALDKIEDPELKAKARDQLKDRFAMREYAENMDLRERQKTILNAIDKGMDITQVQQQFFSDWKRLDKGDRAALQDYARRKIDGTDVPTKKDVYYNLVQRASNPSLQNEFKRENLLKYTKDLSSSDWEKIVGLQAGLAKGDKNTVAELQGIQTSQQIVKTVLSGAGIDPTPKDGTKEAAKVALFWDKLNTVVAEQQQATGKKMGPMEVQKAAEGLLVQEPVDGTGVFGWDWTKTEKRRFELGTDEKFVPAKPAAAEKDVPKPDRDMITASLKRMGKPITADMIVYYYNRKISGMTK